MDNNNLILVFGNGDRNIIRNALSEKFLRRNSLTVEYAGDSLDATNILTRLANDIRCLLVFCTPCIVAEMKKVFHHAQNAGYKVVTSLVIGEMPNGFQPDAAVKQGIGIFDLRRHIQACIGRVDKSFVGYLKGFRENLKITKEILIIIILIVLGILVIVSFATGKLSIADLLKAFRVFQSVGTM